MNIDNAKTDAFQRRRERLSKSFLGPLGGAYCIPESTMTAVRKRAGASPKSGFHVTQVVKESLPTPRARYGNNVANMPGMGLLGEGNNGTVYLGYWGPSSAGNAMAIKIGDHESVNREARILKEFRGISPHIPALYLHRSASECKAEAGVRGGKNPLINYHSAARDTPQSIMYSEYASGGNIESFFGKFGGLMGADDIRTMVFQVLWTLDAMQKKMPEFRHGDMIMSNIMVDVEHHDRGTIRYRGGYTVPNRGFRLIVGDFGLAHGSKDGMKPARLAHLKGSHGIGPNMMRGYDAHLFLTDFATFLRDHPKAGEFKNWVKTVIPAKYNCAADQKQFNSDHLVGGRLRHGLGSDIPSVSQMLSTSYFSEFKKPKYVSRGEWPRRSSSPASRGSRKKPAPPKVSGRAPPRLQRAQVVRMNKLIQAAKNMGRREVTEENKALAKAVNALIKNEGSRSPKLRPERRRRSRGARSPIERRGVNMQKMYNLLRAGSPRGGGTINLTKPRKQNVSRLTTLKRAIDRERDAFSEKWANVIRAPLTPAKAKMFTDAGLTPPKQGTLYNAMGGENRGVEWRKKWLKNEKEKIMNSMNKRLIVSNSNLAEFVDLMGGKTNYLSSEQIARLPSPKMNSRRQNVQNLTGANRLLRLVEKSKGTRLPNVPSGMGPAAFFKAFIMNSTKSDLSKLPAADLRVLADLTLKNAIPEGAVKDQVVNALIGARNNPDAFVNNNRPAGRMRPLSAPVRQPRSLPVSTNSARARLRESQELAKTLKPRAGFITLEQAREINRAIANSEARLAASTVKRGVGARGRAKISKKNVAAAMKAAKKK